MVIFKINCNKRIGKNNRGHIVTRHREKGIKSLYIPIDLNYFNFVNSENLRINLLSVKNNFMYRNTKLILGLCTKGKLKGEFRYIIKPYNKFYGDFIKTSEKSSKKSGDINYIFYFDINDKLYNLEFKPRTNSKICLSAECSSILLNKKNTYSKIRLPSNKIKKLNNKCCVVYGDSEKIDTIFRKKAGAKRLLGHRPKVRGSAMNACDHPHGGGEGKAPIGKRSIYSFTGRKVKGVKTVKIKNDSIK